MNNPLPRTVSAQVDTLPNNEICLGLVDIRSREHLDWEVMPKRCVDTHEKMRKAIQKYFEDLEESGVI